MKFGSHFQPKFNKPLKKREEVLFDQITLTLSCNKFLTCAFLTNLFKFYDKHSV